jgi:hypothetical protein
VTTPQNLSPVSRRNRLTTGSFRRSSKVVGGRQQIPWVFNSFILTPISPSPDLLLSWDDALYFTAAARAAVSIAAAKLSKSSGS